MRIFYSKPVIWIHVPASFLVAMFATGAMAAEQANAESGLVEGAKNSDGAIRIFKGIPFAAPPLGDLRWKAPQRVKSWSGVRKAEEFSPRCIQPPAFGDMVFRDKAASEDCLYLNIWTPATSAKEKLPVIVWFYGGGFFAGSSSEPRYDGENLAKKGAVIVSPNYRLGVFGFLSHPELTKESGNNASGNYGLLDQVAALQWVARNIAAFGGDPRNVTIAGESAGSFSVSALMASPLAQGLFEKAIGESGAFFPDKASPLPLRPLSETESLGVKFAASVGANSLAELRNKPADELLQAAAKSPSFGPAPNIAPNIDGYFLPSDVRRLFREGKQSHVPLLAGWNADEGKMMVLFAKEKPTARSFADLAHARFGDQAEEFLKLYPAATNQEAVTSAEVLAGDDFTAYSTWEWLNTHGKTGSAVYRYLFAQVPAIKPGIMIAGIPLNEANAGSRHSGEIEYVFQTLKWLDLPWSAGDFKVSDAMSSYWVNFAKNGDPNGSGLPRWPRYDTHDGFQVMHLSDSSIHAAPESHRDRYEFLETQTTRADGGQ